MPCGGAIEAQEGLAIRLRLLGHLGLRAGRAESSPTAALSPPPGFRARPCVLVMISERPREGGGVRKKDWASLGRTLFLSRCPGQGGHVPRNDLHTGLRFALCGGGGDGALGAHGCPPPLPLPDSRPRPGCSLPGSILSPEQLRSPDRTQANLVGGGE